MWYNFNKEVDLEGRVLTQQNIFDDGKIVSVNIREEMKRSYIDYAMSVIVVRALPDVRDGLKPVNRRIL